MLFDIGAYVPTLLLAVQVQGVSSIVPVHVPGMISVLSRISNTASIIHITEVEMI